MTQRAPKHGRGGRPLHHQQPPEHAMYNNFNGHHGPGVHHMYGGVGPGGVSGHGGPPQAMGRGKSMHPGSSQFHHNHHGPYHPHMPMSPNPMSHEMSPNMSGPGQYHPMHHHGLNGHASMGPSGAAPNAPQHPFQFGGGPSPDIMRDPAIQQVNDIQSPGTIVLNGQYEQVLARCHGTIDKIMAKKGFGFISCAELQGMHVFFHFSQMLSNDGSSSRNSSRDGSDGATGPANGGGHNNGNGPMPPTPPLHCEVQFTLRYNQEKRAQAFEVVKLESGTMARLQQEHGYGTISSVATPEKEGTIQTDLPSETFYHTYSFGDYNFNKEYPLESGDIVLFLLTKRDERFQPAYILVHKKKKPVITPQSQAIPVIRKPSNAGPDAAATAKPEAGSDEAVPPQAEVDQKRYKGRICSMKDNFGFIKRIENLPEIFFHYSQVSPDVEDLNIDDDVEFSIQVHMEKGQKKGPCAFNITKCKERLVFENITHHAYYGCILQTPRIAQTSGSRRTSAETSPDPKPADCPVTPAAGVAPPSPEGKVKPNSLAGVIVCKDDNNQDIYYEYHDRERRGNLYTLMLGDPITFQIVEDLRTGEKRAVNVMLNYDYFESRGEIVNANIPADLVTWYGDAMKNEKRERGIVAAVKDGFGFIKCVSHDQRMFFHCNEIIDSALKIRMKDEVEFTVLEDNMHTEGRCHATRIIKLPKNTVVFHTLQDQVLEGTLFVQLPKVTASESGGSAAPEMYVVYKDGEIDRKLAVPGMSALNPKVRLFLTGGKVDCEVSFQDLNKTAVHFQIQQSKKNNAHTAVNILPKEWVEISSSQDGIPPPPITGKVPQNNNSTRWTYEEPSAGSDSVFYHSGPQTNSSANSSRQWCSSVVQNKHASQQLHRSVSTPVVDKIMQNSRASASSDHRESAHQKNNFHTPVKPVKSNPNFLKNEKAHYGYIVTTKDNYGFIESENHEHEVFFHYSEILDKSVLAGTKDSNTSQSNQSPGTPKKKDIKDSGLMRVSNAGYVFGAEVSYIYADKDGKLCAQQVRLLEKGKLTAHEVVGAKLYTGKMTRPCKSVDPNQSLYYGEITVMNEATPSDVNCHNDEMRSIQRKKDYSEVARPPIVDGAGILVHDRYPFTINFSTISLADPNSLIAEDDFVVFNVSTNKISNVNRAVNITAIRAKQVARVESIKGDYGFISYKTENRGDRRPGLPQTPSSTGNLFFHSSELIGTAMGGLLPGDLVEFTVVHSKRTNKYCGAKIRFIERPDSPPEPSNRASESISVSERGDAFLEHESYPEMQTTEMPTLPGNTTNRAMRSPGGFRRISRNGRTSFSNNFDEATDLVRSNSVHSNGVPNSPLTNGEGRPERIARFKKTSINAESLKNFESQTSRQPNPGNVESRGFSLLRQHSSNENAAQLIDTENLSLPVATTSMTDICGELESTVMA